MQKITLPIGSLCQVSDRKPAPTILQKFYLGRIMERIYLDNNATTPLLRSVLEAMAPFLTDDYGNPASSHWAGRRARRALEDARERAAALLGAHPDEVVFTSGATEANNHALFGLTGTAGSRVLVSPIEHPSVAEPVARLEQQGILVDRLQVNQTGVVQAKALSNLLLPDTRLVAVMLANNETGAIQPIGELAAALEGHVAFHCDAAQAVGRIPVHFHDLGVTTLALSAHKFHGPKGVGVLLIRRQAKLAQLLWGGHQQQGRRPGTEAVALAVGLAAALQQARDEASARTDRVLHLRGRFIACLRASAGPAILNGPEEAGIPHTINVSFPGCRADSLLMNLDLAGIACSTGSACSSGSLLPSPVLRAMGVPEPVLHSAMRFSLSHLLTPEEVDEAAQRIAKVVIRLRQSAAYDGAAGGTPANSSHSR
jgi:cysteine desulfurase